MSNDTASGGDSQGRQIRSKKSRSEMETLIRRAADEDRWDVFTEDPKVIRLLERRGHSGSPQGIGRRYSLEPGCISFRSSSTRTEETRAKMAARARANFGKE